MEEEKVKVDAIVIGGGPAGLSAAFVMAQEGLEVVVIERGEYAGSKNVSGLFYGSVINEMIPKFYEKAPIERPVTKRSITFLGEEVHASINFGSQEWTNPPYNNSFVVYRAQFDRWFASEVEEAGAIILDGMVAEELLYEGNGRDKKVVGVGIRGDEDFYSDIVILATGANSPLTESVVEQLGLKAGKEPQAYALGAKEIISLSEKMIDDRFNLSENEGAALDFIGTPFEELVGGGFIYTARENLVVGFAAKIDSIVEKGISPNEILDGFKKHPVIKKYLRGGETVEYSAHMIPEGGYLAVGELTANGLIIVGDSAGLLNMAPLYQEGSNLAMASGKFAGETALLAMEGKDFSKNKLSLYGEKLKDSFVMQDLEKYKDVPQVLDTTPELFSFYPKKICDLMVDLFTVNQEPKAGSQKQAIKSFMSDMPKLKALKHLYRAKKLL